MGTGAGKEMISVVADLIRGIPPASNSCQKCSSQSLLLILAPNVAGSSPLSDIEYSHLILIVFTHPPAQLI